MSTIAYRPACARDQAYVSNSWVTSLLGPRLIRAGASDKMMLNPKHAGGAAMTLNRQIDALLDDKRTRVLVACVDGDEDSIVGWMAFARMPGARVLEFVHVRRARRGEGVARELAKRAELLLDNRTPLLYLFESDDTKYLLPLHPSAVHVKPEEFLP